MANMTAAASTCESTLDMTTTSRGNQIFFTRSALSTIDVVPDSTPDWKYENTASPVSTNSA